MTDASNVDPKLREATRRIVERSRREQGLPPHIEDLGILAALAAAVIKSEQNTDPKETAP